MQPPVSFKRYRKEATRNSDPMPKLWRRDCPLRVVMIGTDFEVRVWDPAQSADGSRHHLFRHRGMPECPQGGARRRRRGRQEPDLLRGAVPPRVRQERRPHRLSLGPHPQARHAGLGSRPGGDDQLSCRLSGAGRRPEPGIQPCCIEAGFRVRCRAPPRNDGNDHRAAGGPLGRHPKLLSSTRPGG
jgi:hypothetical protein